MEEAGVLTQIDLTQIDTAPACIRGESKRLPCDACGHPMEPEHAHYKCPACGYIQPCCGW